MTSICECVDADGELLESMTRYFAACEYKNGV